MTASSTAPKVLYQQLRLTAVVAASAARRQMVERCVALLEPEFRLVRDLEAADILLPNAPGEAQALREDLRVTAPIRLVPCGVDGETFSAMSENTDRPIDVLYIARFEPHKNQLGLIRALRRRSPKVVLVGPDHPHHPTYREQCRQAAQGTSIEIRLPVPDDELPKLYGTAKVHITPSWYETAGLSSLEAAAAGCQVVTTSRGDARDYFGNLAWYCDPADERTITSAVWEALEHPVSPKLRDHVLRHFTWDATARATLEAYELLLGRSDIETSLQWPAVPTGATPGDH